MATKPACRGVSPMEFVKGCSSNGVNVTLTRIYTEHKTRIVLVYNPAPLRAARPGVQHVSIRSTGRVCQRYVSHFARASTTVLYTTMTSFAPVQATSGGVGERKRRLALRLRPARSVTRTLKGAGRRKRGLIKFTLRARSRTTRTVRGLGQGGFSFVILGSLGSSKTNFHRSAGGVAVLDRGSHRRCPLGSGGRITRSVVSRLMTLFWGRARPLYALDSFVAIFASTFFC